MSYFHIHTHPDIILLAVYRKYIHYTPLLTAVKVEYPILRSTATPQKVEMCFHGCSRLYLFHDSKFLFLNSILLLLLVVFPVHLLFFQVSFLFWLYFPTISMTYPFIRSYIFVSIFMEYTHVTRPLSIIISPTHQPLMKSRCFVVKITRCSVSGIFANIYQDLLPKSPKCT